jgi:hypothetical protein
MQGGNAEKADQLGFFLIRAALTFAGFKEKDQLAGVISYEKKGYDLVICRLTVHP